MDGMETGGEHERDTKGRYFKATFSFAIGVIFFSDGGDRRGEYRRGGGPSSLSIRTIVAVRPLSFSVRGSGERKA